MGATAVSSDPKDRSGSGSRKPKRATDHGVMVPLDSWSRLIDQLGNLHAAGRDLAEATERAAKAETEVTFLRERLSEAHQRIRQLELDARRGDRVVDPPGSAALTGPQSDVRNNGHPEAGPGLLNRGAWSSPDGAPRPAPSSALRGPVPRAGRAELPAPSPRRQIPSPPQVAAKLRRWWRYVED